MEAGDHLDTPAIEPVVECIREARKESTSEADGYLRKRLRKTRHQLHDLFERVNEGIPESWALGLVPLPGQGHIGGRLRTEADPQS